MKRRVILIVSVVFLSIAACSAAFAIEEEYVEGEALVLLRNNSSEKLTAAAVASSSVQNYVEGVAASAGAEAVETFDTISAWSGDIIAFVRSKADTTEELIRKLKENPNVISASPNRISHATATPPPDDPDYTSDKLWGLLKINAPAAWGVVSPDVGSPDKYVAVLDTGVLDTHEDLVGNLSVTSSDNFTGSKATDGFKDDVGHGTHVSGTIGAVGNNKRGVVGVNWKTNIITAKVLYRVIGKDDNGNPYVSGSGTSEMIIGGLNHVASLIEKKVDVAAVNMSLGGWWAASPAQVRDNKDPYYVAFKALQEKTVIVVAAGNEASEVGVSATDDDYYCYPASFIDVPNMIVVAASDSSDKAAEFTNYSEAFVDVHAPGVSIWSTYVKENVVSPDLTTKDTYAYSQGTSMAAPHVTGAVALLAEKYPDYGPTKLKRTIIYSANKDKNPLGYFGDTQKISRLGLLDIGNAIDKGYVFTPATGIVVSPEGLSPEEPVSLTVKKTVQLTAAVTPDDATDKFAVWESSNPSVAKVDRNGLVTGVARGVADITAKAVGAEAGNELISTVKVTVKNAGTAKPGSSGGGGGCDAGTVSVFALLSAGALLVLRKKG
jgi:subtilisin family serine protease